jgi:hypothetical protein
LEGAKTDLEDGSSMVHQKLQQNSQRQQGANTRKKKKINITSTINHGHSLRLSVIGFSKRSLLKELVLCIIVLAALNAVNLYSRSVNDIMHFTGI